jgi:RHS repeat-associated protein
VSSQASVSGSYDLAVYNAWFNAGITDASRAFDATRSTASYLQSGNYAVPLGATRWLRFAATQGSALSFNLKGHLNAGSFSVSLMDSAGNTLKGETVYNWVDAGQTVVIEHTVGITGVYYLKVSTWSSGSFDLSGSGFVPVALSILSIAPPTALIDSQETFILTGTGFTAATQFALDHCDKDDNYIPSPANTATQVSFRCTPRLPGPAELSLNGTPIAGKRVFVDHPYLLGDPASRNIPAVKGVATLTGNYHHSVVDMEVPGRGVSFTLARSYNSSYFGYESARGAVDNYKPWRFNWDVKIGFVNGKSTQIYVQRADGSGATFFKDSTDGLWYPIDQDNFDQLLHDTTKSAQTTLLTRSGLKYVFDNPVLNPYLGGKLISIYDHDGNGLTVTRDGNNRVGSVTDASLRKYTFTYDGSSNRLLQVTDFTGRSVQYTWESDSIVAGDGKTYPRERIATVRDVRSTTANPIVTTYHYKAQDTGNAPRIFLDRIVDPRGNTALRLGYVSFSAGGWRVASVTDALNNTWTLGGYVNRNNDGLCLPKQGQSFEMTVTNPPLTPPLSNTTSGGVPLVYRFDNSGRLTSSTNASGACSEVASADTSKLSAKTYNTAALVQARKSALGVGVVVNGVVVGSYDTRYEHTPAGNLASKTDAENGLRTHVWDSTTALLDLNVHTRTQSKIKTETPEGNLGEAVHAYEYALANGKGKLTKLTPPGLAATALSYNANGLLDKTVDARLNETRFVYDTHGFLTQSTQPGNLVTIRTPDALGREWKRIEPRGAAAASPAAYTTTTTYDAAGNVLTVSAPKSGTVSTTYDPNGNRTSLTDGRGKRTDYVYNERNELKQSIAHLTVNGVLTNVLTEYQYDALGRLIEVKNPNLHASHTVPNPSGQPLTQTDALRNITTYTYDLDDRVKTETDPDLRVTFYEYDKVGRVIAVTRGYGTAVASTRRTAYTPDGRVKTSTDPDGNPTQYRYDLAGRLVKVIDAKNGVTTATYDGNGNQTSVTDPNDVIDPDGRTTTRFAYDALNRQTRLTDPNGQYWETLYDLNGNVIETSQPGTPSRLVTRRTYDEGDQLTKITFPDGATVVYEYDNNGNRITMLDATGSTRYEYDELNRLSKVTDPQGQIVGYVHDGVGNLKTLTYPGGQAVAYAYDSGERLVELTDWLNKKTTYTLNRSGQVTAIAMGNNSRSEMSYDAASRLTHLLDQQADGAVIARHALTLDKRGNITQNLVQLPLEPSLQTLARSLPADRANQLRSYNGSAVTHDPAGRMTGLMGHTYRYDARDLITEVSLGGTPVASFAYNGDGHRVTRTLGDQTTRFVIGPGGDLPKVLAETNAAGSVQRRYVYGYGLLEQIDSANAARYYHYDPTGSTLALSNSSGVMSDRYAYTPFGETTASGATVNPFRYVGKLGVMDDGNGMNYMRARYYRPDMGRFMSLDAVLGNAEEAQGLNRYAYVRGNPVMGVDPSGLFIETAWDVANVAMDVASLGGNIATGNVLGAVVDVVGLGLDLAATVVPGVPGGAGTAIKAVRSSKVIANTAETVGRNWRDIYARLEKSYVGNAEKLKDLQEHKGNKTIMYLNTLGITKTEGWAAKYEHVFIGATKGRKADAGYAKQLGLSKKIGYDQHHEDGYLINVPDDIHKATKHIGDVGLKNMLVRLRLSEADRQKLKEEVRLYLLNKLNK